MEITNHWNGRKYCMIVVMNLQEIKMESDLVNMELPRVDLHVVVT